MRSLRQVFLDQNTTATAHLRGVGSLHKHEERTSIYRFVRQQCLEGSQSRIVRGQRQVGIVSHEGQFEVFQGNQAVMLDQPGGEFVPEISANASNMFVQTGYDLALVLAPEAALLGTRQATLRPAQFGQRLPQPTRVVNEGAIREGQQAQQAHVDTHVGLAVEQGERQLALRQFQHEVDVPSAGLALENDVLDDGPIGHFTVQLDLDVADVLHVQDEAVVHLVVFQAATVPVGVLDALEACRSFVARIARRLPGFQASKVGAVRFVQAAQGVLDTGSVGEHPFLFAPLPEVGPLCDSFLVFALRFKAEFGLGEGIIVHVLVFEQEPIQKDSFTFARVQPVFVAAFHRSGTLLRLDIGFHSLFRDCPDTADVVAAAPQAGQTRTQFGILLPQLPRGEALELIRQAMRSLTGWGREKQVDVVGHDFKRLNRHLQLRRFLLQQFSQIGFNSAYQNLTSVLGTPDQVILEGVDRACAAPSVSHTISLAEHSIFVNHRTYSKGGDAASPVPCNPCPTGIAWDRDELSRQRDSPRRKITYG